MRETMNGLIEKIGPRRFFRIHRSRIVNVRRVKELLIAGGGDYQVVLWNGTRLGLSRLYRDALQEQLAGK
jgi:two-component system LytT family response regulator